MSDGTMFKEYAWTLMYTGSVIGLDGFHVLALSRYSLMVDYFRCI